MSKSSFRATPRAQPCTDAGPTFDEAPIGRLGDMSLGCKKENKQNI